MGEADRRWVESMSDAYQRQLVPTVFLPFAKHLAARAAELAPRTVLEVAAGTGVLTSEVLARLPQAEVVATDLNEAMVTVGRRHAPRADWRSADAMSLPFDEGAFDLVLCQFGAMFFPDKRAAFGEVGRVLSGHGHLLLNAWGPVEQHDFEAAVVDACDRLYPEDPPTFMRSVPHHYADVDDLVADLEGGGWRIIDLEPIVVESPPAAAFDLAAGYCLGTPLRFEIAERGGDVDATIDAVGSEIERRLGCSPVTGRMLAHVITAAPR